VTDLYRSKLKSAAEAAELIRSGDGVYLHSNAGVPRTLVDAMVARAPHLRDVKIYQLITLGAAPYADLQYAESFYVHSLFIGPNVRKAVADARADYTPVYFSELPALFRSGKLPVDVCLLQCSPPDSEGNMSFGLALDCTPSALTHARTVIVEVNRQTPCTTGSHQLNVRDVHCLVEADYPLPERIEPKPGEVELAIGRHVAALVDDGATIQMGIGAIPNGVMEALKDKRDLGVHSELVSDGILDLIESGVINNSRKTVLPGKIVVSFMFGSHHLYKFVDGNPMFEFHPTDFVNDPYVIAQNYKMTSINSALQIDLTGQVCADSIGSNMYSGFGGQVDFIRGAKRSPGGKAIIALPSTAKSGKVSRIAPMITTGGGVVTNRADVQYVVTEYGAVDLHGMNMKDRVKALISIAHPSFRAELESEAKEKLGWMVGKTPDCVR
jgi:4-hydroxybutyrate CoA-transferase